MRPDVPNVHVTGATRVFAILGDPISHSRSPLLHNAAFRDRGLDAVYAALRCDADDCAALIHALSRAGGGGNVTIPHKGVAAQAVEKPSPRVKATNACNTFWLRKGRVHGENTDVLGFEAAVKNVIDDVRGTRALIVGAGGGARAVLYSLLENGSESVTVLGRARKRAAEITNVAGKRAKRVNYITSERELRNEGFDLVVNATPLGLHPGERLPLRLSKLGGVRAVMDIVYRPGGTDWVHYAQSLGIPASDGLEMLIQQAAAAFELWFDIKAPIATMRRAFES